MALIYMDGFDYYSNDEAISRGWSFHNTYTTWNSLYGRFGGIGVANTYDNQRLKRNIGVNKSTLYIGVAIGKWEFGTPEIQLADPFAILTDELDVHQVKFHLSPTYEILVYQGDDTLLATSAVDVLKNFVWQYLELKVVISATVGVVEVRVNGVEVINETGLDTKNGSDYMRNLGFAAFAYNRSAVYDDLYIDDAQFHGDCRIKTFFPDSDSAIHTDFVRSAGSNDYECVDETDPNEDTDYIYANVMGDISTFGITTGTLGTVIGIQLNNYLRKDDAGTRKIKPLIRSNGADYQGTELDDVPANYIFYSDIWETDPDDSNPWTQTKLEAAEFGLEITT
jgi:hypothetical protein